MNSNWKDKMEMYERFCKYCNKSLGKMPDVVYTKDMSCETCAMKIIDKEEKNK